MSHFGLIPSTSRSNIVGAQKKVKKNEAEIDVNFISNVAMQLGVNVNASDAALVAENISAFLKNILSLAKKFQKACRRKTFTSEDIEHALAFYGIAPQFGYDTAELAVFRTVGNTSGGAGGGNVSRSAGAGTGSSKEVFFVREDPDVDLQTLINAPQPKLPLEPYVRSHWLVINGVQPSIPENPAPTIIAGLKKDDGGSGVLATVTGAGQLPEGDLSDSYGKHPSGSMGTADLNNRHESGFFLSQMSRSLRKTEQVQVKQITSHSISLEQQVFFKEITEIIVGNQDGHEEKRKEALQYLQIDTGLNALVPRFAVAIVEGVRCNIAMRNLAILSYLMRMVQSLANNPNVSLERCLHDIIPSVMSCILARQLSESITSDAHWRVREFSSKLLSTLIKSASCEQILPRVTRTLSQVFHEPNVPMATLYGAIFALNDLGSETIRTVILPNVSYIGAILQRVSGGGVNNGNGNGTMAQLHQFEVAAVERINNLLVNKIFVPLVQDTQRSQALFGGELRTADDYRRWFGRFGDDVYRICCTNNNINNTTSNLTTTPTDGIQ